MKRIGLYIFKRRLGKLWMVLFFSLVLFILVADQALACPACVRFTSCITGSDNSGTVVIPMGAPIMHTNGYFTPEAGDEFAVFRPNDNLCAGAIVWQGPTVNDALTVWGDSAITPEIDGMLPGEEMRWRVWDASAGFEYAVIVEYDPTPPFNPTGEYVAGGFYRLIVFEPTAISFIGNSVGSSDDEVAIPVISLFGIVLLFSIFVLAFRNKVLQN